MRMRATRALRNPLAPARPRSRAPEQDLVMGIQEPLRTCGEIRLASSFAALLFRSTPAKRVDGTESDVVIFVTTAANGRSGGALMCGIRRRPSFRLGRSRPIGSDLRRRRRDMHRVGIRGHMVPGRPEHHAPAESDERRERKREQHVCATYSGSLRHRSPPEWLAAMRGRAVSVQLCPLVHETE
jgi:hypothetical protein